MKILPETQSIREEFLITRLLTIYRYKQVHWLLWFVVLSINKALRSYIYIYIYMLLLAIDGQTAGPNWPNFFEKPMGTRAITLAKKIGKRRSLQLVYNLLAEGPCVARGRNKFKQKFDNKISNISAYDTPRSSMSVHINFSPIGSAVWPAIRNIYMSCFLYRFKF